MNKQQQKPVPPGAIICSGSELCSVLAALRRAGKTPSEPEHVGPDKWLVVPGGSAGEFQCDLDGGGDRVFAFNSFDQGVSGQLEEP